MTHEETIKRIQKLVPSVMDLDFGCEVLYGSDFGSAEQKVILGNPYAVKDGKVFNPWNSDDTDDLLEILGKPITLSVLCLALENNGTKVMLTICSDGIHIGHSDQKGYYTHCYWNLSKDNFNDQSEETKTFIGGLLTNSSQEE